MLYSTHWDIQLWPPNIQQEGRVAVQLVAVLYSWALSFQCSKCYDDVLYGMQKLLCIRVCYKRGVLYSIKCYIVCYVQLLYSTSAYYIALNIAIQHHLVSKVSVAVLYCNGPVVLPVHNTLHMMLYAMVYNMLYNMLCILQPLCIMLYNRVSQHQFFSSRREYNTVYIIILNTCYIACIRVILYVIKYALY